MISYLFLAVSLLSGAAKGFCGKKTSGLINGVKGSLQSNLLRMVICFV